MERFIRHSWTFSRRIQVAEQIISSLVCSPFLLEEEDEEEFELLKEEGEGEKEETYGEEKEAGRNEEEKADLDREADRFLYDEMLHHYCVIKALEEEEQNRKVRWETIGALVLGVGWITNRVCKGTTSWRTHLIYSCGVLGFVWWHGSGGGGSEDLLDAAKYRACYCAHETLARAHVFNK